MCRLKFQASLARKIPPLIFAVMNFFNRWVFIFSAFTAMGYAGFAQSSLPEFTVQDKGKGRVVISWRNPYPNLIQLAVQRSYDSLKRFGTVYSTTSPELPVNGFGDKVPEGVRVYYRIFYVMEGGAYFFTKSMRPVASDDIAVVKGDAMREQLGHDLQQLTEATTKKELEKEFYDPNKPIYIKESETTGYITIPIKDFRMYRDSIMTLTKDTLVQTGKDTIFIQVYDPPFAARTSQYIYTNKDGYIVIKLDDADKKKYQVTLMDEEENQVMDLKKINDPLLILDKTNFYRGGWYKFTLRENGRIKEKGKVYLPKDFRP
jgi:hypothetical protein